MPSVARPGCNRSDPFVYKMSLPDQSNGSNRMKHKIIYLCYLPLMAKREKDFFITEAQEHGFSVEYWDLTKIFFPDMSLTGEIDRSYVRKIDDYAAFKKMLSSNEIKRCFFVIVITLDGMVIKLHRLLTKNKCFLVFFARAGLPASYANESLLKKLVNNYRRYLTIDKMRRIYLNRLAKIYQRTGLIKYYDLVFTAGSVEASRYGGRSNVVPLNHFDYDSYLRVKDRSNRTVNNEYCVFLDDNLVYDTDFRIINERTVEAAAYFKSLCAFFERLEKKHNLKVIIAAHPKAEYQGAEFRNREIIKGNTNELVKDCRFAIAHYSTSISFAVLYKKPIVFMYTSEMKDMFYFQTIKHLASALDARIVNIDAFHDEELQIGSPDYPRYDDYKYKYLTSKSTESRLSARVFIQHMTGLAASVWTRQA
jgi:hypothetical protein